MAQTVLDNEKQVLDLLRSVVGPTLKGERIRCHGDLNLHNVLYTGKDFLFIDFEGKPHRSIVARRTKRSPLSDVAAMLHSLHSAATEAAKLLPTIAVGTPETMAAAELATTAWHVWCSSSFLRSYLSVPEAEALLPPAPEQRNTLLEFHLMAEAIDELELALATDDQRAAELLGRIWELVEE